ncbi:MAG: hypothetical protein HQL06_17495 [Nitrospirae bacterium]|nr:hypothetical protein [Nitrospirota bacterium]
MKKIKKKHSDNRISPDRMTRNNAIIAHANYLATIMPMNNMDDVMAHRREVAKFLTPDELQWLNTMAPITDKAIQEEINNGIALGLSDEQIDQNVNNRLELEVKTASDKREIDTFIGVESLLNKKNEEYTDGELFALINPLCCSDDFAYSMVKFCRYAWGQGATESPLDLVMPFIDTVHECAGTMEYLNKWKRDLGYLKGQTC